MIVAMSNAARIPADPLIALSAALDFQQGAEGDVPEWIQLTPVLQGDILTHDGRGPYRIRDAAAIIAATMADGRGIPIDENHSTDLAAPAGRAAPARGWIRDMQARPDGIWGRVEWTAAGRALLADRAYRAISPVLMLAAEDKRTVRTIPRASLVNVPNLRGLAALNQENSMAFMANTAAALGLAADASEDAILTAIGALRDSDRAAQMPALQSALAEIGLALGLEGEARPDAVVAAARLARGGTDSLVALQAQVNGLTAELDRLNAAGARAASEAFIDRAIAERRAGVNATNREDLVSLHMASPAAAEKLIGAMPMLTPTGTVQQPPAGREGAIDLTALNAEQQGIEIARLATAWQAAQAAAGTPVDFAAAVHHISEKLK